MPSKGQSMIYKIINLDGRYSWNKDFQYMIEFARRSLSINGKQSSGVLDFDRSRRWFNETFGWSQDVEVRQHMLLADKNIINTDEYNQKWAWSISYDEYRIYVATEDVVNWFVLKHPVSYQ